MGDAIAGLASAAKVAPGSDAAAEFGPVQNKAQYQKVLHYLAEAGKAGKIVAGGEIAGGPGYFVPLTVVRDVAEGSAIVDEEPFGPILPIILYRDVGDSVARPHAPPFPLRG